MSSLIGRIALQPSSPRPGETVRVEVFDNEDKTMQNTGMSVVINGVPGAVQYLQFPSVGQRRLVVRAIAANGDSERQVALLDVQGGPLQFSYQKNKNDIAMIGVSQSPTHPYDALLTLGSFIDTRTLPVLSPSSSMATHISRTLGKKSLATRLVKRSPLAIAMAENAASPARVEARRLSGVTAQRSTPLESGARATPIRPAKISIATVYDLTEIDHETIFGPGAKVKPQFEWDFGDGSSQTTSSPLIRHDFFPAIDHKTGIGQFVVTCRIKHLGITVKRTLTIHSAYAICKRTGTVVPHVSAEIFAHKRYNMVNGTFTVYNVEDTPIVLDRLSVTPLSDDGDAPAIPKPFVTLKSPITIAPQSASMVAVNVPFVTGAPQNGQLHYDVKGFSVLYAGSTGSHPVRCSAVFDIPVPEWGLKPESPFGDLQPPDLTRKPWPWELVEDILGTIVNPAEKVINPGDVALDKKTGTLAVSLGDFRSQNAASQTRAQALQVLSAVYAPLDTLMMEDRSKKTKVKSAQRSKVAAKATVAEILKATIAETIVFLPRIPAGRRDSGGYYLRKKTPPAPGFVGEGQVCDPDNLTEDELALAEQGQLVCQLTDETDDYELPARWMNARKGDIILSPGGEGIIGGLLLNVNPSQFYSHSGMMTKNYEEITHSTGSQGRLMDHMIGVLSDGSDGFEPSVLKYVWPGAVTQTVQASVEGEIFPDPEYDKSYSISSFGPHMIGITHNDQMKMIPPLVIKPDPMQETPAVRAALHAIATDARSAGGRPGVTSKYHYRWYCYTDPTIGKGAPEGPGAGWAAGTRPSVCSSFIWLQAKGRNAHLETDQALVMPTDLEQSDIDQGAMVRPVTPDGLYTYSAEERDHAAHWLYDMIYNQAYEKAGWFGEILTDGADDVANQFLNAFANDDADGKDSTDWETAVVADAVSPDNLLWWDGPDQGGLYGYAEPALYREPRIESYTVSRWKKVLTRGTVRGKVFNANGNPVGGALVQVYDGKTTFTAGDGSFVLTDVPFGSYMLKSSKVIDGVLQSVQVSVTLNVAELIKDLHLQQPADRYRIAQVFIDFWGRDDEFWADDEITDPGPEYFELELGPDKMVNSAHRTYKWGGEVRVEYDITVRLLVNNTIDVAVQGTLYEGTSEDTDDLDGTGGLTFQSPVGNTAGATLTITNTDEGDPDAGVLSISVKNVRNNN
ncbi:MAG: carboxypeptidase-like regulatory domain-containing protein [Deltaproteobacteria bacterium]|nr:carboxypeptidase-like regulatory domain-containing protein [Deltaproteobacteria bacterium]